MNRQIEVTGAGFAHHSVVDTSKVCVDARASWSCPNMKAVERDLDMSGEHYKCRECGRTMFLDYEEIR